MNFISFKNIKLFPGPVLFPRKKKNAPSLQKEEKASLWKKFITSPFFSLFLFVLALASLLSYIPSKSLPTLEVGEIASADVIAPFDLTIEDTETTEKRKKEAMETVVPVYSFDANVLLRTEEKIREFFSFGREKIAVSPLKIEEFQEEIFDNFGFDLSPRDLKLLVKFKFPSTFEENLISLLTKVFYQGIVLSKNLFIHGEREKGLIIIKSPTEEKTFKAEEILDIKECKDRLSAEIEKIDLAQREKALLTNLAHLFLSPNLTFNKSETEARKEKASARVETVYYTLKKGKVIVRKGDEVSQESLKWIKLINERLQGKVSWLKNLIGTFLLFALLFIALWYYLKSISRPEAAFQNFLMTGTTLILSILFYKLSLFLSSNLFEHSTLFFLSHQESYYYGFPFQLGALVFAFLTASPIALVYSILNALLIGYLFSANFYLMLYSFVGSLAAIYGVKYYGKQKRTNILRAGLFTIAPVNFFVIVTLHLVKEEMGNLGLFLSDMLMGFIGAAFSASVAFILLPVYENLFGFVTASKLLELTNSDLPIFRQMAIEAPGSYHHSLVVASLAEKASEEIKLDSMLVKAGAFYHDIGKIKRPEYFIENNIKETDRHKDLNPSLSSLVIINHVKEGVELAKKLNLPRKIREIIEQHHGNSLVRYFYQKAKEKYGSENQKVGEERYRYPGPAPKSKEAGIILLADSVEAASRSLKSPTQENLRRVISEIFENYLRDGQLDACDFSIRELRTIASSFLANLYTIYHPRPSYPGFDFERKNRKNNSHDRNTQ